MAPDEPHPLEYGRPQRRRRPFLARPFYRDYVVAYVLIASGMVLFDRAGMPPGSLALEILGATLLVTGLLIFVSAIVYSIWFVLGGKHKWSGRKRPG
jgi:hypothetical protein